MSVARKPDPFPRSTDLQLCTLIDEPFDDPDWIFEPKLDGLRVLVRFDGRSLRMISRNGKDQDSFFPDVVAGLERALKTPALLDGEIVCLDERGLSSFPLLQQRFHVEDKAEVARRAAEYPAILYVFDTLYANGRDLAATPLIERKQALHKAVRWSERIRETPFEQGRGTRLFSDTCRRQGEGIIGKRRTSTYRGGRAGDWVKIKCGQRQELVIAGFTEPQRSRVGLGALLVGYYDDDGKTLRYAGKVGTGYDNRTLKDLRDRLGTIETTTSPFPPREGPHIGVVHWTKPVYVAEIAFGEWTQNGMLRQPRFEGLRMDKKATQVRRERPQRGIAIQGMGSPARSRRAGERKAATSSRTTSRSPSPLQRYTAKRDFTRTPEPSGKRTRKEPKGKGPRFVIQEHAASHLHWDFRLEAEGVLKSWAVPKEPSMDPAVKRLAVEVEDHPLDYGQFEGDIPSGSYGAGHVEIWDQGTYTRLQNHRPAEGDIAEDMARGKIEVELHGKKLKGGFALVRMARGRKPNWLLMKMRDDYAREQSDQERAQAEGKLQAKKRKATAARAQSRTRGGAKSAAWPGSRAPMTAVTVPEPPEPPPVEDLEFTNLDKVMFPEPGYTKGDLIDYYRRVAPRLIPLTEDRPASLERLPDGLGGVRFWQKNTPASYPDWVPRVEIPTGEGKPVNYVLVNNVQTLLYLVNQGTISIHTGFSRVEDLDRPDFVLFDLDPGGAAFKDLVKIATTLRPIITKRGLEPSIKTSGKSGLHITVPWTGAGGDRGYGEARAWARQIAEELVDKVPDIATLERSKSGRDGKVYVDVEQNALGKHAVPAWAVRATPSATVSTPLDWGEVTPRLDPSKFTVESVFKRTDTSAARKPAKPVPGRGATTRVGRGRATDNSRSADRVRR